MAETAEKERLRKNRQCLEHEVRHYWRLRAELEDVRADIIEASHRPEVAAGTGPGDPVWQKVRQLSSPQLLELQRRLEAIEWALGYAETHKPSMAEVVKLWYSSNGHHITDEGAAMRLGLSRSTFHKLKREFIQLVGWRLGWPCGD